MKKFLSLVLALVMTMSLVTVSAGAKDFTDSTKIQYAEAVDVMSAVKVIDGYAEGDFRPTTTLTRGAAAKIICNLILGPTTASALVADAAPYKDVPTNHTFAGYIAYCQKEGIISGYADGTFKPANSLTGYAFMKMLLGALGYDSQYEGYTGANWSINVAKRALNLKLNKGLIGNFNGVKAVTREEACLYAFNTLKADMVEYTTQTIVINNGDVSADKVAKKILQKDSGYADTMGDKKTLQFAEKYFPDLKKTNTNEDDFKRPATEWKFKKVVIGTYAETPDAVYTAKVKGKEVYGDLSDKYDFEQYSKADAFFVDGKQTAKSTKNTPTAYTDGFAVEKNNDKKIGGNGVLTEVYVIEGVDDDPDTVRIVMINTYAATVEDDYDKDDEELEISVKNFDGSFVKDGETLSSDDFKGLASFKEDDVALVTLAYQKTEKGNDLYEIKSIEKAETTTAKVTTFDSDYNKDAKFDSTESSVTAGGTKYSYSAKFESLDDTFKGEYEIDEESVFYLDAYGYVIAIDEVKVDDQYVYIDSFEASGVSTKATVSGYGYFTDGTAKKFVISKIDDEKIKGWDSIERALRDNIGLLFTYKVKSDDKYELTTVDEADSLLEAAFDISKAVKAGTQATLEAKDVVDLLGARATKETKFVVIDGDDDVTVYTGIKNLPDIDLTAPAYDDVKKEWLAKNGKEELNIEDHPKYVVVKDDAGRYAEYVFIDLSNDDYAETSGASTKGSEIFLYEDTYDKKGMDSKKNVYYQYNAVVDGKDTTVKFNEDYKDLGAGLYSDIKLDENGYVKSCKKVTTTYTDALRNEKDYSCSNYGGRDLVKKGDVLTFVDPSTNAESLGYYLADDCKVVVIDDGDVKNYSLSKIEDHYSVLETWTIMNDDQEVTTLFLNVTKK